MIIYTFFKHAYMNPKIHSFLHILNVKRFTRQSNNYKHLFIYFIQTYIWTGKRSFKFLAPHAVVFDINIQHLSAAPLRVLHYTYIYMYVHMMIRYCYMLHESSMLQLFICYCLFSLRVHFLSIIVCHKNLFICCFESQFIFIYNNFHIFLLLLRLQVNCYLFPWGRVVFLFIVCCLLPLNSRSFRSKYEFKLLFLNNSLFLHFIIHA